ncbi:SPOC domain-like protein [Backusella circina FSU 941]|nr:SPOC domain-like protein [Backusella circina FSU 941]
MQKKKVLLIYYYYFPYEKKKETQNQLAESQGGYENITEICDLSQPFLPLLRTLEGITITEDKSVKSDIVDALIIAIAMIEKKCKELKYIKHAMLLTDGTQEIDWLDFDQVKQMLITNNIMLTVVGVDLDEATRQNVNYVQWDKLTSSLPDAFLLTLDEATNEIYAFCSKDIRPTPIYNGFLYIGNTPSTSTEFCAISCKMYLRATDTQKPLMPKPYSGVSKGPSHHVIKETKYFVTSNENTDTGESEEEKMTEVSKADLEKGYRFGKSIVKVSPEELEYAKNDQQRELTIMSFVPESAIPRDYYLGRPYVVTSGDVDKESSGHAISALAHALFAKEVGAIVRWVKKKGEAPKVGILLPHFEPGVALLHFIQLPYCNDIRFFQFGSQPASTSNNPEEKEAERLMDEYIDKLDLDAIPIQNPLDHTESICTEHLIPEETFNPTVFMVNKAIKERALNPSGPLPELDPRLCVSMGMLPEHQAISEEYGKKLQKIYKTKPGKRYIRMK